MVSLYLVGVYILSRIVKVSFVFTDEIHLCCVPSMTAETMHNNYSCFSTTDIYKVPSVYQEKLWSNRGKRKELAISWKSTLPLRVALNSQLFIWLLEVYSSFKS